MLDLSSFCGVSLKYDELTGKLVIDEDYDFDEEYISLNHIEPILLNKFLKYPEQVYRRITNVRSGADIESSINYNIYEIPSGLLGVEYIKTHIYSSEFKKNKSSCVIEVVKGDLKVIIQEHYEENAFHKVVENIQIIELSPGEKLSIPSGVYYTFVNTSSDKVIFAKLTIQKPIEVDYSQLKREKGLAFYIISKNARLEIVANPKYKRKKQRPEHIKFSELETEKRSDFIHDFLDTEINLFEARRKFEKELAEVLV